MSWNVADWRKVRIMLGNLYRLLKTRVNVSGLLLRDRI